MKMDAVFLYKNLRGIFISVPYTSSAWCFYSGRRGKRGSSGWVQRGSSFRAKIGSSLRVGERERGSGGGEGGPPSRVGERELLLFFISLRSRGQAPGPPTEFWVGSCEAERSRKKYGPLSQEAYQAGPCPPPTPAPERARSRFTSTRRPRGA